MKKCFRTVDAGLWFCIAKYLGSKIMTLTLPMPYIKKVRSYNNIDSSAKISLIHQKNICTVMP